MSLKKAMKEADKVFEVTNVDGTQLKNLARVLCQYDFQSKGWFAIKIEGVKTLFLLKGAENEKTKASL